MNSLMLRKEYATYGIIFNNKDYFIKMSSDLNKEIKTYYKKGLEQFKDTTLNDLELFRAELDYHKHFPYYKGKISLTSSASFYKLQHNPYLPQRVKNKIKAEIENYFKKNVKTLIQPCFEPINESIFVQVNYDPAGRTLKEIRADINLGTEDRTFLCKETAVQIYNPKVSFGTISEDYGDTKISWNFKYPVNVVSFIGLDLTDGVVDYVNSFSRIQFENPTDFHVINFYCLIGNIKPAIKALKDKYEGEIQFLWKDTDFLFVENLLILDLRDKEEANKQEFIDKIHEELLGYKA